MNKYEISLKTQELRRQWGIDNYCPINIKNMAIKNLDNLSIIYFPMHKDLIGCSTKSRKDNIICINSQHTMGRHNTTIAHQLYHLLYDSNRDSYICNTNSEDENEKTAENFASNLLIPRCALNEYTHKKKITHWQLEDVIGCEQYFQVSHTQMLYTLKDEKLITHDEYMKYKQPITEKARNLGYDTSIYEKTKKYHSLGKIIPLSELAYDNKRITRGKYNEILMDVYRSDIVYNMSSDDYYNEVC